jgi:DNA (cytosine-5)-methyltransferase 1
LPKFLPLKIQKKEKGKNISHKLVNDEGIKHHEARFHNERDIEIFKNWLKNDMNKSSSQNKISFYNELIGKKSNHAKYRNLEWDKPSPTIVAHLYKDGLMFIHPDIKQLRSITVREAALLQSFPIDYEFVGSNNMCFKMVGNAVPPIFATKISNVIHSILTKNEK